MNNFQKSKIIMVSILLTFAGAHGAKAAIQDTPKIKACEFEEIPGEFRRLGGSYFAQLEFSYNHGEKAQSDYLELEKLYQKIGPNYPLRHQVGQDAFGRLYFQEIRRLLKRQTSSKEILELERICRKNESEVSCIDLCLYAWEIEPSPGS
jgi:hypothetical protein